MGTAGQLVVISGPSGAGKTSVCRALKESPRVSFSVSATTRAQRPGEHDGLDYHFLSAEDFASRKDLSAKFDRVCFRGFSSLSTCIATGLPFLKPGGRILLKKSPDEMPDSTHEIHPNARIIGSKEVEGFRGQNSLMMVVEKRST